MAGLYIPGVLGVNTLSPDDDAATTALGPLGRDPDAGILPGDTGPLGVDDAGPIRRDAAPAHSAHPRLDRFLQEAKWPAPADDAVATRMETALEFFQKNLGAWCDLPLDANNPGYQRHGFGPWSFKIGGKVTNLTSSMQAINFECEVHPRTLAAGRVLRRYALPKEPKEPTGIWYTDPEVSARKLALPPQQTVPQDFKLAQMTEVLASTAGDMLVDWRMQAGPGQTLKRGRHKDADYDYRKAGGVQYVVPNAGKVLKAM